MGPRRDRDGGRLALRRRDFIALLVVPAALLRPLAAAAQSSDRVRRVGLLIPLSPESEAARRAVAAVQDRLRELGWVEGQNLQIDARYSLSDDRDGEVSRELLALHPDVILVGGGPVVALQKESRTVPIVFVLYGDPVGGGLVTNLAHPAGNLTGFTHYDAPLCGKWVQILKEVAPQVSSIAGLYVRGVFPDTWWQTMDDAARSLGIRLFRMEIHDAASITDAIGQFATQPSGALISLPSGITRVNQRLIIGLTMQYRLPTLDPFSDFAQNGGLISYGVDRFEQFRLGAGYVDRILRGEKPGDLPIQEPSTFELVVNLKCAKALGLIVPRSIISRADEVIE